MPDWSTNKDATVSCVAGRLKCSVRCEHRARTTVEFQLVWCVAQQRCSAEMAGCRGVTWSSGDGSERMSAVLRQLCLGISPAPPRLETAPWRAQTDLPGGILRARRWKTLMSLPTVVEELTKTAGRVCVTAELRAIA